MEKRFEGINHYFLKDINPVIRFLTISDIVIIGGNEAVAGIAAGIYLAARSILQIPIAHFLDKIRGERDDFWLMFVFSILSALIPLFYLVVHTPLQLYIVQFALGLFTAFTYPAFMAIFTRHIDKNKECTEWGLYFYRYNA